MLCLVIGSNSYSNEVIIHQYPQALRPRKDNFVSGKIGRYI